MRRAQIDIFDNCSLPQRGELRSHDDPLFSRSVLSGRAAHLHHHHLISVTVAPDLRIENIPALR